MEEKPSIPAPQNRKKNLTEGPVSGHLIRLTLPMTWGIFAIISFQLVDMFYISMLGTQELAALSLTFPVTMGIFSLFIGFQIAMASVGSRLIGAGEMDIMRRVTTHAVILVFALGLAVSVIGFTLHDTIFAALGATPHMLKMVGDYMYIWLAGAALITIPMINNAAMRANGDSMTPAIIMTVAALINLILDPLLIFGLFGFPRLEIQGAAIATLLANAGAVGAGLYLNTVRHKLLINPLTLGLAQFGNSAKRLLFIAIPAGLTNTIQPIVNAFIFAIMASYGEEAIAAFGVVTRIEAFAFIILMAMAAGMAPIIGQNWGAKRFERVEETLKLAIRFSVIWSIFVALVLVLFGQSIAAQFSSHSDMVATAALFFWIVPPTYAFSNLVMGWGSAFNAMGMPQRSMLMIVVKMLVLTLPCVLIGNALFGLAGIFGAIALVNIIAGLGFHIMNWRLCKKQEEAQRAHSDPA